MQVEYAHPRVFQHPRCGVAPKYPTTGYFEAMQDNDNRVKKPNSNGAEAPNVTHAIFNALDELNAADERVTVGTVVDRVLKQSYALGDVVDEIARLHTHGEIYQPSAQTIQRTPSTDGGTAVASPQRELASAIRNLADEIERAGRQLSADNVDVDVTDGVATIVARYDLEDSYDIDEDPAGLTEPCGIGDSA